MFEFKCAEGRQRRIGVHLFAVRMLAQKVIEVCGCTVSDDAEGVACGSDFFRRFCVVSHLLTAEQSTKMPDKNQNGGAVLPQFGKGCDLAGPIEDSE